MGQGSDARIHKREKAGTYGYPGDTMDAADARLRAAWSAGFVPYAMLYRAESGATEDYVNARAQIESMLPITFGKEICVLILTDRLPGCARGFLSI